MNDDLGAGIALDAAFEPPDKPGLCPDCGGRLDTGNRCPACEPESYQEQADEQVTPPCDGCGETQGVGQYDSPTGGAIWLCRACVMQRTGVVDADSDPGPVPEEYDDPPWCPIHNQPMGPVEVFEAGQHFYAWSCQDCTLARLMAGAAGTEPVHISREEFERLREAGEE